MKTALVTGGTGFVGSHVIRRLIKDGFAVHMLCRESSNFWRLEDVLLHVERHVAPLENAPLLQKVIKETKPEYVFHLAAATVVAGSAAAAEELIKVNLLGTVNLLEACKQVDYQGLVTTGDSFEYSNGHQRLSESESCHPDSLHGISKLAATLYAQAMKDRPVVTLRLFSTYGPGDHPKRLVPRVIAGAVKGEPLTLSRRDIQRDWVYIDDVTSLYLEVAREAHRLKGQVFNAGSGVGTNLGVVVDEILNLTGSRTEARWGVFPAPPHDDYPWVADPTHTFASLQWRPSVSLEEGLRRTIASMQ